MIHDGPPELPDASPLLTELRPEDFPTYFAERDGRLFHSHGCSPYPLPVDTPEQRRLNVQHIVVNRLIGANYVGPVSDILAPEVGRQKIALDLCTGTGRWVMDMGREFPHVHFRGLDIVPIATRYPLPNVRFEVHDANTPSRWGDKTVELVHARSVSMAIRDYPAMLQEIGRILRPGGLFISCEWGRYPSFYPSLNLSATGHAPRACRFFEALKNALRTCRGIEPVAARVPDMIFRSGFFTSITTQRFYMPIGPWHADEAFRRLGRAFRAAHVRYADSVKPILLESGLPEDEVAELISGYIHELKTTRNLVSVYHTVYAIRM
ncbi:S-adenosyl-L-methionine-dependent methyltransferase [Infundibulicybe gibba]|nr:S-adenosyl-L-methionine-dependent methyltransferase [Infundibulicybe gibba]